MKLSYGYIVEHLRERFSVLAASAQCDSQYAMPIIFTKDKEIESGRIYLVNLEDAAVCLADKDILAIICCHPDQKAPTEREITNKAGARCRYVYLEISQNSFTQPYECLVELFYKNAVWLESLWGRYLDSASTIKDYLDESVEIFNNALLYYPLDEWRSCISSISKRCDPSVLSCLFDENGKAWAEGADYTGHQAIVESFDPIVLCVPTRYGTYSEALAVAVRDKSNLYQGLLLQPIIDTQTMKAQLWHISKLRDMLEIHLNERADSNEVGPVTSHGLLQRLLSENTGDLRNTKRHLRALGFLDNNDFVCAFVCIYNEGTQKTPLKLFCSIIENMGRECYAVEHESNIVAIINTGANKLKPENLIKKAFEYIKPVGAYAGISFPFKDILLLPDYAKQAKAALETGIEIQTDSQIHMFKDIATAYIVSYGTSELPARVLCAPGIIALKKLSGNGGVDYIATLRAHIRNSYNASLTARDLHIHRSTLRYRLKHIIQLTQMDFDNPDDRLYLELSLAMLHL